MKDIKRVIYPIERPDRYFELNKYTVYTYTVCVYSCTYVVSQDRRHLVVTPCSFSLQVNAKSIIDVKLDKSG